MASAGVTIPRSPDQGGYPGGLVIRPPYQPPRGQPATPAPNNSLTNQYGVYNAGVEQNAEDYSDIMSRYRSLFDRSKATPEAARYQPASYTPLSAPAQLTAPQTFTPKQYDYVPPVAPKSLTFSGYDAPARVTAEGRTYTPDENLIGALNKFKGISDTGGYSDQDIEALRARGISPIRSVYANAQRNIERNRSLRGGMGANYGAVNAKMARELADTIGEQTNRVNAGIAEQVAAGKLEGTKGYGSLASSIDANKAAAASENMAAKNRIAEFNANASNRFAEASGARRFETEKYNTDLENQYGLENARNRAETDRYNVEGANKASLYNNQNFMDTERYNTEGRNRTNDRNWESVNDVNRFNAAGANDFARFNAQFGHQNIEDQLRALEGMRGLYGTTPALASVYGNQAQTQAQMEEDNRRRRAEEARRLAELAR